MWQKENLGSSWEKKKRHPEIKLKLIIVLTDFFPQTWFLVFNKEEKLSIQPQHDSAGAAPKRVLGGLGSGETCRSCHYGKLMFAGPEVVRVSLHLCLVMENGSRMISCENIWFPNTQLPHLSFILPYFRGTLGLGYWFIWLVDNQCWP